MRMYHTYIIERKNGEDIDYFFNRIDNELYLLWADLYREKENIQFLTDELGYIYACILTYSKDTDN